MESLPSEAAGLSWMRVLMYIPGEFNDVCCQQEAMVSMRQE